MGVPGVAAAVAAIRRVFDWTGVGRRVHGHGVAVGMRVERRVPAVRRLLERRVGVASAASFAAAPMMTFVASWPASEAVPPFPLPSSHAESTRPAPSRDDTIMHTSGRFDGLSSRSGRGAGRTSRARGPADDQSGGQRGRWPRCSRDPDISKLHGHARPEHVPSTGTITHSRAKMTSIPLARPRRARPWCQASRAS